MDKRYNVRTILAAFLIIFTLIHIPVLSINAEDDLTVDDYLYTEETATKTDAVYFDDALVDSETDGTPVDDIEEEDLDIVSQGADINISGIYVIENDNEHVLAGAVVDNPSANDLEYRWIACRDGESEWFEISSWKLNFEYLNWTPANSGNYTIVVQVRVKGYENTSDAYVGVEFHKYIKGKCQMPYTGEGGGYLIGFESKENPAQSYKYEMLILDCTLLAEGKPAWIYTTGKCGVAEGNALWTVWQPQYGYYWTLFRLFDADGNLIDEVCYGFKNVLEETPSDLPEKEYGWVIGSDERYYFYDRTTGVLQRGGTADGISLTESGYAVIDNYSKEKLPVLVKAKSIVNSICSPTDTLAQKQEKCYKYVAQFPYLLKEYPVGDHLNDWACLDAHYANNILNAYGDQVRQGAECVGEAAALAYLYAELNFGDVYLYISDTHGWVYAGGRYWDPLFVESKGRQYYNAVSYDSQPSYIYKIN